MKRRPLDLRSFDDLRADVRSLIGRKYQRAGTWSLAQVCGHLSLFMDNSMNGFNLAMPWYFRAAGPMTKWVMLRTRWVPAGAKAPDALMPPASGLDDLAEAERFLATIDRYVAHAAPLQPSPFFGNLRRDEWDRLHLLHSSHHLSFIVPEQP